MAEAKFEIGGRAPAFTLADQDGAKCALTSLAGSWVVIYFYPKDDTPGCTTEGIEFTALLPEFRKAGAVVLGVSPDTAASHRKFCDKHALGVRLLADTDRSVMAKYGAYGTKMHYGKEIVGVVRSTVLIDPKGRVAHHWKSVKAKGHAAHVLARLRDMSAEN